VRIAEVGGERLVAYLRCSGDSQVVAAINFGPKAVRAALRLPGPVKLCSLLDGNRQKTEVP